MGMTLTQIIANFDDAQDEYLAAAKELATRPVGNFEIYALAETYRRDPDLALRIADASAPKTPVIQKANAK